MSLTSMIRSTLGVGESGGHMTMHGERLSTRLFRTAGVAAGAAGVAYVNGRMPSPGQDHVEVSFGGKSAPLDLVVALGGHALGLLDLLGGYSENAHDIADGALAAYLVRVATRAGSEAGIHSQISKGASPAQIASGQFMPNNVYDVRAARARKYSMNG